MGFAVNHIPFEQLVSLVEGRLAEDLRTQYRDHIAGCETCRAHVQRLERVIGLMRSDDLAEPEPAVVGRALRLFRPPASSRLGGLRQIRATMRFDSYQRPLSLGMRADAAAGRDLLYSAEEHELDIHITPAPEGWVVAGQVVGPAAGGQVELRGSGALRAELTEMSDFVLPAAPAGVYALHVLLAEVEIEVADLELGM